MIYQFVLIVDNAFVQPAVVQKIDLGLADVVGLAHRESKRDSI